eukprot:TRINITY_DN12481_c0_g1_i1.p1 TRINITY_DN12481_c0_g1~~TRINITY_DN12481_c0_g1_i1.p1  ORF type:complete len:167 (+),score=21.75 TRINITY_DN12481_c0_g1_i1:187-687(+)
MSRLGGVAGVLMDVSHSDCGFPIRPPIGDRIILGVHVEHGECKKIMTNFKLPSTNGVTHLPSPTGPFSVGFVDIFTPPRNGSVSGLLLRLYYPSSAPTTPSSDTVSRWARWFPLSQYANGYLRYKFASLGPLVSVLGRILSGSVVTHVIQQQKVLDTNGIPPEDQS